MYLKGTEQECKDYNNEVTIKEKYNGSTTGYATVDAHQNGADFSILKHFRYESELEVIENQDGWFKKTEI
jgi:hypothetical protein